MKKTLLVNYVYWQNVGHSIEALRYALGYHIANPEFEISLALNKNTTHILASLCPWVSNIYTIDIPDDDIIFTPELFQHIPKNWDYVSNSWHSTNKESCPGAFWEYYREMEKYLNVRTKSCICGDSKVNYSPNQTLDLQLPVENLVYAKNILQSTHYKIGIMFGGHKDSKYFPSLESWKLIIRELNNKYKDVSIYLFGTLKRTLKSTLTTTSREEIDSLITEFPNVVDCFDIGIVNQLAVIKGCDLFISPHTGFAFAVVAVGTPWLTISGGPWAEYFYNGSLFYSVLPENKKYPCYKDGYNEKVIIDDGERVLSMCSARIQESLGEILDASEILISKKWTYDECLQAHFKKLTKLYDGDTSKINSFDNIHKSYF